MNMKKFMTTLPAEKLIFWSRKQNIFKKKPVHTMTSDIQLTNDELLRSVTYS